MLEYNIHKDLQNNTTLCPTGIPIPILNFRWFYKEFESNRNKFYHGSYHIFCNNNNEKSARRRLNTARWRCKVEPKISPLRSPIFGFHSMFNPSTNYQIRHGNAYRELRHCILHNASRGLSATPGEFLVLNYCLRYTASATPDLPLLDQLTPEPRCKLFGSRDTFAWIIIPGLLPENAPAWIRTGNSLPGGVGRP